MLLIAIASLFTAKKIAFYAVMISVIAISVAIYAIIKLKRELDPHHLASIFRQSRQVVAYINSQVDIKLKELNIKEQHLQEIKCFHLHQLTKLL